MHAANGDVMVALDVSGDVIRFAGIPIFAVLAAAIIRAVSYRANGQTPKQSTFSTVWLDLLIASIIGFLVAANDASSAINELGFTIKTARRDQVARYIHISNQLSSIEVRGLIAVALLTLGGVCVAVEARRPGRPHGAARLFYRIVLPYAVAGAGLIYSLWQGGAATHLVRLVPVLP